MGNKVTEQLKMPIGTASNRLKKMILLNLLQKLGDDNCFKCGERIENPETLSIEHKIDWLDNDPKLFWDLNNISFSHKKCNKPRPKYGSKNCEDGKFWCSNCKSCKSPSEFYNQTKHPNPLKRSDY